MPHSELDAPGRPKDEREAARKAIHDLGAWCGVCDADNDCPECIRITKSYVDAVAPHLYRALRGENEALRKDVRREEEAAYVFADRLTECEQKRNAAEAQLAAAREALLGWDQGGNPADDEGAIQATMAILNRQAQRCVRCGSTSGQCDCVVLPRPFPVEVL